MQNVGRAPNWAYHLQYMLHKSKDSLMQEMRCRKGNISTHFMRIPIVGKVRMQTLGFARMDLEQIKEVRLNGIVVLSKGDGLLNSPL